MIRFRPDGECPILKQATSATIATARPALENTSTTQRIVSIDIFRGLNVLVMIFVDNLGLVAGLPWWTYHMPGDSNGMTYVDMVFPAFLFLMGMSIPLSLDVRERHGASRAELWKHVVVRSLSLVVLGLFVANAPDIEPKYMYLSGTRWKVLGFVAMALVWAQLPGEEKRRGLRRSLRLGGLVMLAVLFVMFRGATAAGQPAWLSFADWEILGLLGWAYLLAGGLYLLFRTRFGILVTAFAGLVAINTISTLGWLKWINAWPPYVRPFEAGLSALTMAGVLASLVIVRNSLARNFEQKARWIVSAAALLVVVGYALRPLGISKIRDTPTWCLYCTAANLLIALLLYWVADVKGWKRWAKFAMPAGKNPLLAYFVPYLAYLLPQLIWMTADGTSGRYGVMRSALFAACTLVVTWLLTRGGVRLRA